MNGEGGGGWQCGDSGELATHSPDREPHKDAQGALCPRSAKIVRFSARPMDALTGKANQIGSWP